MSTTKFIIWHKKAIMSQLLLKPFVFFIKNTNPFSEKQRYKNRNIINNIKISLKILFKQIFFFMSASAEIKFIIAFRKKAY